MHSRDAKNLRVIKCPTVSEHGLSFLPQIDIPQQMILVDSNLQQLHLPVSPIRHNTGMKLNFTLDLKLHSL